MTGIQKSSGFKWTPPRQRAAFALADGATRAEAAAAAEVSDRSIYVWLQDPEFAEEVDRLTLMTGIATRAARLRLAKRVAEKLGDRTDKDLLEWLKFIQSETTGAVNDFADRVAAAITADHRAQG